MPPPMRQAAKPPAHPLRLPARRKRRNLLLYRVCGGDRASEEVKSEAVGRVAFLHGTEHGVAARQTLLRKGPTAQPLQAQTPDKAHPS